MDHFIELPKSSYKYGQFYALRAVWDSMRDAGIKSGDILIIRQQSDIDDWDIAVVVLGEYKDEERATLKRVYKTPQAMILKPENDSFPVQIITWPSQIRWKLISVIRNY
jgi:repressor LexA